MAGAHTRARTSDPDTSHAAAKAIEGQLPKVQQRVLAIVRESAAGLTQHAIIQRYRTTGGLSSQTPESTIRTRVAELVDKGLLRDSGRRLLVGYREAIVWELVV